MGNGDEFGVFNDQSRGPDKDRDPNKEESITVAVVENRAREICLAVMNRVDGFIVEVYIVADSHTFIETITTLRGIGPDEILLPDNARGSTLSKKIKYEFASLDDGGGEEKSNNKARLIFMSRRYFDQDLGAELLKSVIVDHVDADLVAKYTVLASCYCLLRYIENITGSSFAAHSMRLSFKSGTADRMFIDRRTAAGKFEF